MAGLISSYNLKTCDFKTLARIISIVENEGNGCDDILFSLTPDEKIPAIGITGPPGAGKSSLISALLKTILADETKYLKGRGVAVLAVDPSSPFSQGALLGDRLRMAEHFNHPKVFIRSLATRGSLGGISGKTLEVADVLRSSGFDFVFIETVGVGQSEIEIVSLADTTIVVLVPESGDDVQAIKSGIMEIADIFVLNKSDREGADNLSKHIKTALHLHTALEWKIPVIKTVAIRNEGVDTLLKKIREHQIAGGSNKKKALFFERTLRLLVDYKIKGIDKVALKKKLEEAQQMENFNLYFFVKTYVELK